MNTTVKHIMLNCSLVTKSSGSRISLILVKLRLIIAQSIHLLVHWFETSNMSKSRAIMWLGFIKKSWNMASLVTPLTL